jgi:hypothetical protein
MIWAALGGIVVGAALMALGASVMILVMIAERIPVAPPAVAPPAVSPQATSPQATFPQAEQKGLALLRSRLTVEQEGQYDSRRSFEVVGSDTGTRYRIRHGRMMNIDELDSEGHKVCEGCFLPEGNLVAGDCMLAQKIALEMFESRALAIANRRAESTWRQGVRSQPSSLP